MHTLNITDDHCIQSLIPNAASELNPRFKESALAHLLLQNTNANLLLKHESTRFCILSEVQKSWYQDKNIQKVSFRISHTNLDEVTCCGHFHLPFGRDNSAFHHSLTGTAPATYEQGALIPPLLGSVMVSGQVAGGAAVLCSKFVPEEKREQSTGVGSFMKTLRPLPVNKARANQLSLCTGTTAGIPKSLFSVLHPARSSREKDETRNQPAQHQHVQDT